MPTVRRYDGEQLEQRPVAGPRVSVDAPAEAFGGGQSQQRLSESIRGLNAEATNMIIKEKNYADQVVVLDSDNKMADVERKLMHDPNTGALNKRGKDAFGTPDTVNAEFMKAAQEVEKGLNNENQKAAFRRQVQSRQLNINKQLDDHVARESRAYDDAVTEASIENEINEAGMNYSDPVRVAMSLENQRMKIIDKARRNGLPDEWTQDAVGKSFSKTHSLIINQMLSNGDDTSASEYYKENKDEILPSDRDALEKSIYEGQLLGEAQRGADEIFMKSDDRNEAFNHAKKIKDPALRKETESQLERMFTRQAVADRQELLKQFKMASDAVEQGKKPPANIWSKLNSNQRSSLDARLKQVNAGIQPTTDWPTYYNLKTMAADQKNDFIRENLMAYRSKMADSEFKELVNLQSSLSKNDAAASENLNGYRTTTQIIHDTLTSAGINPSAKPNSAEGKKVASFRRMVDEQIQLIQAQTGKEAKTDDVQKIVDNLLVKGIVPNSGIGGFFKKQKYVFELKPGDSVAIEKNEIPVAERNKIEDALRRRGLPVTDDRIIELYNRKIQTMVTDAAQ